MNSSSTCFRADLQPFQILSHHTLSMNLAPLVSQTVQPGKDFFAGFSNPLID